MPVSPVIDAQIIDSTIVRGFKLAHQAKAISDNHAIQVTDAPIQILDPSGGAKDVLLPAEASSKGLSFIIINSADAAEAITVKEDSDTTTIMTLAQNERGQVFCDGTTWWGWIGQIT